MDELRSHDRPAVVPTQARAAHERLVACLRNGAPSVGAAVHPDLGRAYQRHVASLRAAVQAGDPVTASEALVMVLAVAEELSDRR